jgi:hypothetical protein
MATIPAQVSQGGKHRTRRNRPSAQASSRGPNWGRLVAEGRAARGAADAGRWRIGHLASLVAKQYGARSLQAFAEDIGEAYATVRRYRWVYTRYEPTVRFRFQQLSFSHFQAVAGLPDRARWLTKAENGCWSVDELVRQSRTAAGKHPSPRADEDSRAPLKEARTHLRRLSSLDDRELVKAWRSVGPAVEQLATEIDRVRDRVSSLQGIRVGPYDARSNGNGHHAKRNGNGRRAKTRV